MSINLAALQRNLTVDEYQTLYHLSIEHPELFWGQQAQAFISWQQPWKKVLQGNFANKNVRWFVEGKLNACYNCIDRHLPTHANDIAIIWQGDDPSHQQKLTYAQLHEQVCRFANGLKSLGVAKGDRVSIYLPMIPEAAIAMLACARIGAVHSIVFAGFSPQALQNRILDADCRVIITADEGMRGGKKVELKKNTDIALQQCPNVEHVIVVRHTGHTIAWNHKDIWYHEIMRQADPDCPITVMDANDPFFILYTSGSTGKPKGILHSIGGYLTYVALTHKIIFNYQRNDIFWCTADIGWITGHSYVIYGPLCNAATTLMFEGVPNFPTPARCWEIIDQHRVNIFYTAPTAIRALMREGDAFVKKTARKSLKLLGSVGEPINPEVWRWYHEVVGNARCPIVDTWWQTETGGILISPIPGVTKEKPGAASMPFFGIVPAIMDDKNNKLSGIAEGALVITQPWPGMMQTIYADHERFISTYFKPSPHNYFTGDGAKRDQDGDYWITGRIDDVINVSGHRIGTAEVESALVQHHAIAEAAVIGVPHEIKGQGIYAYVTPKAGIATNDALKKELIQQVRVSIGAFATPDTIHWTTALPKTRSGKIMRRILRKIACGETKDLGDTSTLADPSVVDELLKQQPLND